MFEVLFYALPPNSLLLFSTLKNRPFFNDFQGPLMFDGHLQVSSPNTQLLFSQPENEPLLEDVDGLWGLGAVSNQKLNKAKSS